MRNVLVTGGSRGLGLGIAEQLAGAGFRVIAIARSEGEHLPLARARIDAAGHGALHFAAADLSDIDAIPDLIKQLRATHGRLYGLVNNAAMPDAGILSTVPTGRIERVVRLNVLSPLVLTKYVARSMMTSRGGRIVNIASIVAATGYSGLSVYSATKSSLIGFTRSLARELGPLDITVNAIAPGFIDTEMTRELDDGARATIARRSALKRAPEIADVAGAVGYLFSDAARNVTGTVLTVDAGNTA